MKSARHLLWLIAAGTIFALPSAQAQVRSAPAQPPAAGAIDAAFQKFWAADSPAEASQFADEVEETGVTFDEALRRLKMGRPYSAQKTGVIQLKNRTADGVEHFYSVNIPATYDPSRKYQVRFQLHGGIGRHQDSQPWGTGEIGPLAGAEQIYVLPFAWEDAPWWSDDQVLNLNAILDSLKRTYNIDENRVALSGVSDGATGVYYIAMRDTTPFASFLPLNGFVMVLADEEIDDGRIYPQNLLNKPIFAVNGGKDPLYPDAAVGPVTQHFAKRGVDITYHVEPEGEHNTKWWPEVKDTFEKFVADHPRDPNPAKLTLQAADRPNDRAHWVVIDAIGSIPDEAHDLPDANFVPTSEPNIIGVDGGYLFNRMENTGRIDLVRTGNTVQAQTFGVAGFTLLLSPDKFDFRQPIRVIANGHEVFNARVERSVSTLLKWAARDNDRTMLYAAEVQIKLKH